MTDIQPLTDAERATFAKLQARANAETLTQYAALEKVLAGDNYVQLQAAIMGALETITDPDDRKKVAAIANVLKAYGGGLLKKIEALKPAA